MLLSFLLSKPFFQSLRQGKFSDIDILKTRHSNVLKTFKESRHSVKESHYKMTFQNSHYKAISTNKLKYNKTYINDKKKSYSTNEDINCYLI